MATITPNLGLHKPDPNNPADDDVWGGLLNDNADILDAAIAAAGAAASAANANANTRLPAAAVSAFGGTLIDDANAAAARATLGALAAAALPIGTSLEWNGQNLPPGFLWEDGSNVSRSTYAALFAAIGTSFGAGNGSTTFTLPDSRGRLAIGRDNMGGTTASRVTAAISGIAGTTLGAAGGNQALHAHSHTISDPGHNHVLNDFGHNHVVNDPGHAHSTLNAVLRNIGVNTSMWVASAFGGIDPNNPESTNTVGTGIWLNASLANLSMNPATTQITGTNAAGAGGAQNMPPAIVKNKIIYAGV